MYGPQSLGDNGTSPVRYRALKTGRVLATARDGAYLLTEPAVAADANWSNRLIDEGLACASSDRLGGVSSAWKTARIHYAPDRLDYIILVPTLRCNLSCSYCQVSRAPLTQTGFDWSDKTLADVLSVIDRIEGRSIKIEFQGGEPTLRCDHMRAVIERCERFEERSFVICTNLERLDDEIEALIARPDVHVSTSLDGDAQTHARNRTGSTNFRKNLRRILDLHGPSKVSALPTVNAMQPPEIDSLLDAYVEFGLTSVFLRPITFHGFARKRHEASREPEANWFCYYRAFVDRLIARNWERADAVMEETYLSICLRRIAQPGRERHVDLRSPNLVGVDYIVIDYDGTVYPTDEARMLARARVVDLSIGTARDGWDSEARQLLNTHATNTGDPDCERCAYQPYCGRDIIDDIARYGTIELPRHETAFCRRHLFMFDLAFELLDSADPGVRYSVGKWLGIPGDMPVSRIAA